LFIKRIIYTSPYIFHILYMNFIKLVYKLKNKKIIVYYISNDYFFDIFKPIYRELIKNSKIRIFFAHSVGIKNYFLNKRGVIRYLLENGVKGRFLFPAHILCFFKPDMFICSEPHFEKIPESFKKVKKVQIYHGVGVPSFDACKENIKKYDLHFAIGPHFNATINFIFKNTGKKFKMYNVGYPKTDKLFKKQLKEESAVFTVVYAPHWNKHFSINKFGEDIVKKIAKLKANLIIKPHHHLYVRYPEMKWEKRFSSFSQKFPNVSFITDPNTQKILPIGDVVVTDTATSVGFESSILLKPLVIYDSPEWFKENKESEIEKEISRMAIKFRSLDELFNILKRFIKKDKILEKEITKQKKKQERIVEKYLYNPGKSTDVAVDVILRELGQKK